jgi:multidrug transporter EmrE-like cation transporter
MHWVYLIASLVLNTVANIILKMGSNASSGKQIAANAGFYAKLSSFLNPLTCLAIFFFALNLMAYRKALDYFDVSIAYPILVSGALVLITATVWLIPSMQEKIEVHQLAGIGLIAVGIWLVAWKFN